MFKLGENQELTVGKKVEFGVYLTDGESREERILLPKKQVPEGTEIGDKLTVFVYKDSSDRRGHILHQQRCGCKHFR